MLPPNECRFPPPLIPPPILLDSLFEIDPALAHTYALLHTGAMNICCDSCKLSPFRWSICQLANRRNSLIPAPLWISKPLYFVSHVSRRTRQGPGNNLSWLNNHNARAGWCIRARVAQVDIRDICMQALFSVRSPEHDAKCSTYSHLEEFLVGYFDLGAYD